MFLKVTSLDRAFQDLSHGIFYFSVTQKIIDCVIFSCLSVLGEYLGLRNREIWNFEWKYGKIFENFTDCNVLGSLQNEL